MLLLMLPVAGGLSYFFYRRFPQLVTGERTEKPANVHDSATEIERIKAKDRADARAMYERVTRDKLDVIKTALAMGVDKQELKDLDKRLEQLIGSDKLHALLDAQNPAVPTLNEELLDIDLTQEIENLKHGTETETQHQ